MRKVMIKSEVFELEDKDAALVLVIQELTLQINSLVAVGQ